MSSLILPPQPKPHESNILVPKSGTGVIPGLVLQCAGCTGSFPPVQMRGSRCVQCEATRVCADYRAELVRLYKKRVRLQKDGASTKSNDAQAGRVRARIIRAVEKITSDPRLVTEIVDQQGHLAREAALTGSRIHLPMFGR